MKKAVMLENMLGARLLFFFLSASLAAMPSGATVVSGLVSIVQDGTKLSVTQVSETAIVEWDDFVLEAGDEIQFDLAEEGTILNRVKGEGKIAGHLSCNGDFYFVSCTGILIETSAEIYSGRFFASTLDLHDQEYLAGSSILYFDQSSGKIIHRGKIETYEGSLSLLAPELEIEGSLRAPEGTLAFGAASRIFLCGCGEQKVWLMGGAGQAKLNGAFEGFKIEARAGVLDVLGEAKALERIVLSAEEFLSVRGNLATQSTSGGEIHLIGRMISLEDALIDASGDLAGGAVLIGGDLNSAFPKADRLKISASAQIHADAKTNGHGGKAILYASAENWFEGSVSARGGRTGGDGGVVAIASPGTLHSAGTVSIEAPLGRQGEYLEKF